FAFLHGWKKLERVRAVRTHHEQKLKQKLVGVGKVARIRHGQVAEAVLPTDLAEFTGPIGKYAGKAGVRQIGGGGVAAAIKASAYRSATIQTIFAGCIHAESMLGLEDVK